MTHWKGRKTTLITITINGGKKYYSLLLHHGRADETLSMICIYHPKNAEFNERFEKLIQDP